MSAPAITSLPVEPADLPCWQFDGADALEYLTILDSVGDYVIPHQPTTHIHPDLAGLWALYQLLQHQPSPPDMAGALAATARTLGLTDLAERLEAVLPAIAAAQNAETRERLYEKVIFGRFEMGYAWHTDPQCEPQIRLAQFVAAQLPRTVYPDSATARAASRAMKEASAARFARCPEDPFEWV
ncbi:hypothetical protein ACN2XU_06715 [Primorskyibacter sp. 2E107]|uniref:hypothetical protein n=1 Tax=Primorskyibacter sp. 2E107 TaxID=3403458 RepID=UPI003AF830F7